MNTNKKLYPKIIMNEVDIKNTIMRMTYQIVEKEKNLMNMAFVGIKTRGEFLARRFANEFEKLAGYKANLGILDITLYRDDFNSLDNLSIGETHLIFDINAKRIILVDDVIYTGRTIRSAIDQLVDFGRPAEIELAILVDRKGRELPISANYIGKSISTKENEHIMVKFSELDNIDQVVIIKK